MDVDQIWPSAYSSVTLRFDGARAANILAGRKIYSYLFKQSDWDRLAELGMESPDFYSQARSFPIRGTETDSVLPRSVISRSRCDDKFFTRYGNWTRVSFCDPAFGGADSALWGLASFGWALVPDGNGQTTSQMLFEVEEYFVKLRITKNADYNDHWFTRLRALGVNTGDIVKGAEVSPDDQVAIQCAELNAQYSVPAENFGYDFSMRAHIVTAMTLFVGRCHAFEYNRPPEGVHMEKYKADSKDIIVDRVSELAFLTADLYESGKLRGGDKCETASMQLSRTKFKAVNKKKKCENKKDYKLRWQGQSPDHRDVLLGLRGMSDIKGMTNNSLKVGSVSDTDTTRKVRSKFRTRKAKRLS